MPPAIPLEINAQRSDEFHENLVREQEERLREEGFYDEVETSTDEESEEASDDGTPSAEPEPKKTSAKVGRRGSVTQESASNGRDKPKKGKLWVKRDGRYVLTSTVNLIPGENLNRKRPRSFGISEKYIKHGVVS
ncbi:MAG: hypothetical protein WBL40_05555 [Terrimicrobiaceae bacterium]